MKLFNFKIPEGKEKDITAIETWVVQWESIYGGCSFADVKKRYQSFNNKESAIEFAQRLKEAHKLLRNIGSHVYVDVQKDMPIE